MKNIALALLAAAALAAPAAAQVQVLEPVRTGKIGPLGGHAWEPESAFTKRGHAWCAHGGFTGASVLPGRKEVRLVCADYRGQTYTVQVLDADAKLLSTSVFTATDTYGSAYKNVAWLERGGAAPLPVAWDYYRLKIWNEKGAPSDIPFKNGVGDVALLGSKEGGPMIVIGHGYGEVGLEAVRPDGKRLWSSSDPTDVRGLAVVRLDGRPMIAALYAVSRLALLDAGGKVRERLLLAGNSDRVLLDDAKEPRLYAFDSGAGSKREALHVLTARKGKDGRRWEDSGPVDQGPITITGRALGRFDAGKPARLVVGTNNGWVFLLDAAGKTVASRKFLSPVRSLATADLDGDKRDELVVVLEGASENVVIYSPQTLP